MQTKLVGQGASLIAASTQDVEPLMVACKEARGRNTGVSSELKHAASIPMVIVESYLNRTGITFLEFCQNRDHVRALVNDKGLQAFRIWPGKV
jgi:hypothetical protein